MTMSKQLLILGVGVICAVVALAVKNNASAQDSGKPVSLKPSWSHIAWREFHGARTLLGVDFLWGYGALEVWDVAGTVEANLDYPDRSVRAGSAESLYGIRFRWPEKLEPGYAYRYTLGFDTEEHLPDAVTVNDNLVWQRTDYRKRAWPHMAGHDWRGTVLLVAEYAPSDESAPVVTFMKTDGAMRFAPPLVVHRRELAKGEQAQTYEQLHLPPKARVYRRPPDETAGFLQEYALTAAPAPTEPLDGPGNGPSVWASDLFMSSPVYARWSYVGDDVGTPAAVDAMRKLCKYYRAAGMKGVTLPFFGFTQKDELSPEGFEVLKSAGLHQLWAHSTTVPEEKSTNWMKGFREHNMNYLAKLAESRPDMPLFVASYEVDQRQTGWLQFPENARYATSPAYERNRFYWEANSADREQFLAGARVLGRAQTFFQASGAAYPMDYFYRAGADLTFCKDICRQSVQIVVANGRGAGRARAKPYGFDLDLWHSQYWTCWDPSELRDILMTYFFGGAEYHFYETLLFTPELEPSIIGGALLETYRLMQEHPPLGESVVPIGVLRGPCETWAHCYARTTGWGWSMPLADWSESPNRDYDLLSIFFHDFGLHWRTDMRRLCTGTPYGPVDFVPWDSSLDHLRTFKLLVFLGPGGLTPGTLSTLERYVEQGGTLVATVDQLRTVSVGEPDSLPREVLGCKLGKTRAVTLREETDIERAFAERRLADGFFEFLCLRDGEAATMSVLRQQLEGAPLEEVTYHTLTDFQGAVIERLPDGAPLLVRINRGDGRMYLFTTERMLSAGWGPAETVIRRTAARLAALEIEGDTSWLEYGFRRVPQGIVIFFINHGRAGYPSGKGTDHGAWRGRVLLRPDVLELAADALSLWQVNKDYSLAPLGFELTEKGVSFELEVDRWHEVLMTKGDAPRWPTAAGGN